MAIYKYRCLAKAAGNRSGVDISTQDGLVGTDTLESSYDCDRAHQLINAVSFCPHMKP